MLDLRDHIAAVPDFPKPGILYRDITPLLAHPQAFAQSVEQMAERLHQYRPDEILAIESRGFLFGSALSRRLGLPLQLARKPGKLPRATQSESYALEYGEDCLEMHQDLLVPGRRFAVVDDLIATGGTAGAVCRLLTKAGAQVACCSFLIELRGLEGRRQLAEHPVESLILYD